MAAREFNCNKIKRTFWNFTMKDHVEDGTVVERGKKLVVRMPQKGVFEAIKDLENQEEGQENVDTIYNLLTAVLNNNMGKIKVAREELYDYDIEECMEILKEYIAFTEELKTNPN